MLQVREGFVYLLKISDIKSFQIHEEGGVSCATVHDMSCSSAPGPWPHLTLQGLVRAHHPHWQDFQEVSSGNTIYNMEKYTECKPHKICFENLRAFIFKSSMLGCYSEHFMYLFCVHFTLHSSTHFQVQGKLFSFYLFFRLHSLRCGFSGVVGGLQCLCQQRPVQHSHHGMHMAQTWHTACPQPGVMLMLFTSSKGES